jgi:hypothetical protein
MLKYLNHAATLQCVHGGNVRFTPAPMRSFHVQGSPILTEPDLLKALILGCPQIGPGLKPCTRVVQIMLGRARQIFVDGEIPLLENLMAMTDGDPPGMCSKMANTMSNAEIVSLFLGGAQARTLIRAHQNGKPLCEICHTEKIDVP